jgi:hypothetical protein
VARYLPDEVLGLRSLGRGQDSERVLTKLATICGGLIHLAPRNFVIGSANKSEVGPLATELV